MRYFFCKLIADCCFFLRVHLVFIISVWIVMCCICTFKIISLQILPNNQYISQPTQNQERDAVDTNIGDESGSDFLRSSIRVGGGVPGPPHPSS